MTPQWLPQRWRRTGPAVWYPALGLLLLVASFIPALHNQGTLLGSVPSRSLDAPAVVAILLESLPMLVCRRWPTLCLALVSVGFAVDQLRGYHSFAGSALPIALLTAASRLERHRRATVLTYSAAYVVLSVALSRLGTGDPLIEFVTFYLALALAWGVGVRLRTSRKAEAERRRRVAEETLAAERSRIARELHDVVTHHVTAMVVQAEAARYAADAPERLDQALTAVTDTGRQAMTDLRYLLDLLNPHHDPQERTPVVGRLHTLVEQTRRAGQPVEFTQEGTPAATTGSADLIAYRVVQEALTNALKYAHGKHTSVQVRHDTTEIAVQVATNGSGSSSATQAGSGRGLAGLRERVALLGGDFSADPQTGGGFLVRARIPAAGSTS
ncbi:histidine kinase [Streptomyces kunmingensis]|uniref:histidine kinase n=1 Tax=Streptomyces kunmingensis TaxID=68225 RepID=A0ABU6CJY7_9ACTN|nr:histidine kinase [Streptomyces kunmingensis]MEB3964306.1 histidine kinase [Streptomyces kunmingensis]